MAGNKLVRLGRNDYIPDLCFWPSEVAGSFAAKQSIYPPPTLVVEILSESTAANDRGIKFRHYAAAGIREYWLIDLDLRRIEQYVLGRNGQYRLKVAAIADQRIESVAIPASSSRRTPLSTPTRATPPMTNWRGDVRATRPTVTTNRPARSR